MQPHVGMEGIYTKGRRVDLRDLHYYSCVYQVECHDSNYGVGHIWEGAGYDGGGVDGVDGVDDVGDAGDAGDGDVEDEYVEEGEVVDVDMTGDERHALEIEHLAEDLVLVAVVDLDLCLPMERSFVEKRFER